MAIKNHHREIVGVLQCMNRRVGTFDHEASAPRDIFRRPIAPLDCPLQSRA